MLGPVCTVILVHSQKGLDKLTERCVQQWEGFFPSLEGM